MLYMPCYMHRYMSKYMRVFVWSSRYMQRWSVLTSLMQPQYYNQERQHINEDSSQKSV